VLAGQTRIVWVLGQDGKPERRRIKVGLTDGASTEVMEGNLVEGEMVITGQTLSSASKTNTNQTSAPARGRFLAKTQSRKESQSLSDINSHPT